MKKLLNSRVIDQLIYLVQVLLLDVFCYMVVIFARRWRPVSTVDLIRFLFVCFEGIQVVAQQILRLIHQLLKERVRGHREVALHFI